MWSSTAASRRRHRRRTLARPEAAQRSPAEPSPGREDRAQTLGLIAPPGEPRAPTRSVLEDLVLDLIAEAGLAHPDVNVPLRIGDTIVIPDFRWSRQRLIVEADGAAYHDNTRHEDARRQALLEQHGERVLRINYDQAANRRAQTVERLQRAGAPSA